MNADKMIAALALRRKAAELEACADALEAELNLGRDASGPSEPTEEGGETTWKWWWLSFADPGGFRGVVSLEAGDEVDAVRKAHP